MTRLRLPSSGQCTKLLHPQVQTFQYPLSMTEDKPVLEKRVCIDSDDGRAGCQETCGFVEWRGLPLWWAWGNLRCSLLCGSDPASTEFYQEGEYNLAFKQPEAQQTPDKNITSTELAELYLTLIKVHDNVLVEDSFAQDDWNAWTEFHQRNSIELSRWWSICYQSKAS